MISAFCEDILYTICVYFIVFGYGHDINAHLHALLLTILVIG